MILYPESDSLGFINLVDEMITDTLAKAVNSARISYKKYKDTIDDKDKKLVSFLLNSDPAHTSPFRHSYFTFHLKVPLFVFRQLVKYQVGCAWRAFEVEGESVSKELFVEIIDLLFDTDKGCSWNEISGRYVKLAPEFYIPAKMRANPSHGNKQSSMDLPVDFNHSFWRSEMETACRAALATYERMLGSGIAREISRMILPQNIYTECYWTISLQAVLHVLNQRLKPEAQYETRRVAECIAELLKDKIEEFCKYEEDA